MCLQDQLLQQAWTTRTSAHHRRISQIMSKTKEKIEEKVNNKGEKKTIYLQIVSVVYDIF